MEGGRVKKDPGINSLRCWRNLTKKQYIDIQTIITDKWRKVTFAWKNTSFKFVMNWHGYSNNTQHNAITPSGYFYVSPIRSHLEFASPAISNKFQVSLSFITFKKGNICFHFNSLLRVIREELNLSSYILVDCYLIHYSLHT